MSSANKNYFDDNSVVLSEISTTNEAECTDAKQDSPDYLKVPHFQKLYLVSPPPSPPPGWEPVREHSPVKLDIEIMKEYFNSEQLYQAPISTSNQNHSLSTSSINFSEFKELQVKSPTSGREYKFNVTISASDQEEKENKD